MKKEIIVEFLLQIFSFLGYFALCSRSTSNICIPFCGSFSTKQRCLEIQSIVIIVISKICVSWKILTMGRKHSQADSGHFFQIQRLFCNHITYLLHFSFVIQNINNSGLCDIKTLVFFSHCINIFSMVNFNYHGFNCNPQTSTTNPQLQARLLIELLIQISDCLLNI